MPLMRKGKTIYHKVAGKWKVKAVAKNAANAKKYLRVQKALEHGWKPKGKKKTKRA